jgi:adenine-specific DNA glycosylase
MKKEKKEGTLICIHAAPSLCDLREPCNCYCLSCYQKLQKKRKKAKKGEGIKTKEMKFINKMPEVINGNKE